MSPIPHARLLVALTLLAVLAAPSWPGTVDDVYISLTYARRWAESGALEWTTGERVEGYSNFLLVALMALAARMGLDIDLLAQVLAFSAAAAALVLFDRRLGPGPANSLALWALAAWAPLNHWAAIGLETTLYALLLAGGWTEVLRTSGSWARGITLLGLASVTRPEGNLHLVAGLLTAARAPPPRSGRLAALGVLGALGAYHTARVTWFGALAPTSFLVKVAPVGLTPFGAQQGLGDLLTAVGLVAALLNAGGVRGRDQAWVGVPLLIQGATLVSASGDWMAWARLTLPGVVASACAYAGLAEPRTPGGRARLLAAAAAVFAGSLLEPHGYGTIDLGRRSLSALLRPLSHLGHGLDTPLAEDVAWAVDHVPSGASVLAVDVGILGDIPGIKVVDMRGLTHRPAAEAVAAGRGEAWLRDRLSGPGAPPEFLRLANWEGTAHPEYPAWMVGEYHLRADLLYGGGSIRWYGTDTPRPTAGERAARWDEVLRRHPSHPFLRWHAALSAAADGDRSRAETLAGVGARRWPAMAEFADAPRSLSLVSATRALRWDGNSGFALACGDKAITRMILPGEPASVVLRPAPSSDRGPELVVDDPCGAAAPPGRASVSLARCQGPRQVEVELRCEPGAAGELGVELVPS